MDKRASPPEDTHESAFFRSWAHFILGHRWLILVFTTITSGAFAHQVLTRLVIHNSSEAFLASGSEGLRSMFEVRENFGNDIMFQVLVRGDVFSMPYLERLKKLHHKLADIRIERPDAQDGSNPSQGDEFLGFGEGEAADHSPNDKKRGHAERKEQRPTGPAVDADWNEDAPIVQDLRSLINVRNTHSTRGGIHVSELLEDWPKESDLAALKTRVLSDRTMVGQVVDPQGLYSVIVVVTEPMSEEDSAFVLDAIALAIKSEQAEGFEISIAGAPALITTLNRMVFDDVRLLFLLGTFIMGVFLTILFRHPLGVLGPMFVVIQAIIWTMGIMAFFETPMTMVSLILPSFILCVGLGDSVHIQSVYRDLRSEGVDNANAIVFAISRTGKPILFTSLTTFVGLISFRFASLQAIRDMGLFGAFGIMVAFLLSIAFLPISLSMNKKSLLGVKKDTSGQDLIDRVLYACGRLSRPTSHPTGKSFSRHRVTLFATFVVFATSVYGASQLRVRHDALRWMPEDTPVRQAVETLDEHVGGTSDIALLVEAREGTNLKSRDLFLALEKLEEHIQAYRAIGPKAELVGTALSLLDMVRETWQALHEGKPEFYAIPSTERGLVDVITLLENSAPDEMAKLVTVDMKKMLMRFRVRWTDAWSYRPLTAHVEEGIDRLVGNRAHVALTGYAFNSFTVVSLLLGDLLRSFGVAFFVISIMLIVLLRNVKLGLIAILPNLLPIVMVMGFMGFAEIPLDTTTLLLASIAIGIAVDDTIHFFHHFQTAHQRTNNVELGIQDSFKHAGRAMFSTSVVLVAGFASNAVATNISSQRFGILVAMTAAIALLVDLIFGPALLRAAYAEGQNP